MNAQISQILSVENRIPPDLPDKREDAIMGRFCFESYLCVCKAVGVGEKICMVELENRCGYHYTPLTPLTDNRLQPLKQFIKMFNIDPVDQWMEITDFCTYFSVNPIWFSGHRVYQLPVQVFARYERTDETRPNLVTCTIDQGRTRKQFSDVF